MAPDKPYRKKTCLFNGSDATSFSVSEHGLYNTLTTPSFTRNIFGDLKIMTDVGDVLFEYIGKLKDRPRIKRIDLPEHIKMIDVSFRRTDDLLIITVNAPRMEETRSYASVFPSVRSLTLVGNHISLKTSEHKYDIQIDLNDTGVSIDRVDGLSGFDLPTPAGRNYFCLERVRRHWGMGSGLMDEINQLTSIHGLFVELTREDFEEL